MSFFQKTIEQVEAADLAALKGVPEGLRLEFKRELDLSRRDQKAEAAKDVSALANTQGGRLLYGVDEVEDEKGENVAGELTPLSDQSIPSRLADVLNSMLAPPVALNMRTVEVPNGFVLIVDVQPSTGLDLHMVLDARGGRFYRRGTKGNIPMREPDVRDAYTRIIERRSSLEERTQRAIEAEGWNRQGPGSSFFVVPLFPRANIIDTRVVGDLPEVLANGPLAGMDLAARVGSLQFAFDGYRTRPAMRADPEPRIYIAILKSGVVHFHRAAGMSSENRQVFSAAAAIRDWLQVMAVADHVLEMVGYYGDVRLSHRLRAGAPWELDGLVTTDRAEPGDRWAHYDSINLARTRGDWGKALRNLVDPYFQEFGEQRSWFFDDDGTVPADQAHVFGKRFDRYVRVNRPAR